MRTTINNREQAGVSAPLDYRDSIIESLEDCIVITDTAGVIQYANKSASGVFGMTQKALEGQNIREVLDIKKPTAESLTMAEAPHFFSNIERTLDISGVDRSIFLFTATLIESRQGIADRFIFTGKDITFIKELKDELVKSRESIYTIVHKSPDGLLVVNNKGIVLFSNHAAEIMLGRKAEELYGMTFGFPIVTEDMSEIDIVKPDGEKGIAEMRSMETDWQGIPSYLISIRDVTENVTLREELRTMTLRDDLTGLYNRRGFFAVAELMMKTAMRNKSKIVLLYADLNDFKDINDRYGHQSGDTVLKETARLLKGTFRDADIVARMGGDEFIVMGLEDVSSDCLFSASRLIDTVTEYNKSDILPYEILLSVGSACCDHDHPLTLNDLIAMADKRMYEKKGSKKLNDNFKFNMDRHTSS